MAGLALGSWWGGRFVSGHPRASAGDFLRYYALSEGLIGLGGFVVPSLFGLGEILLLPLGAADSTRYLFFSAVVLFLSLLPWCFCMGATFPLMMAFLRKSRGSKDSFSFLYTANVLGAMSGTLATPLLVEILGFHGTLWVAAGLNTSIALSAKVLAGRTALSASPSQASPGRAVPKAGPVSSHPLWILFTTGFTSMAMEVVWTRDFTVVLKTQVYSYASILFAYLLSTFVGSWLYRRHYRKGTVLSLPPLLGLCFTSALLTVVLNDRRIQFSIPGVLLSIVPFCSVLGYLTPRLVDRFSMGDPEKASRAYAINVLGCILGPLIASYFLLPILGVKLSLVLLALPFSFFLLQSLAEIRWKNLPAWILGGMGYALFFISLFWAGDYEEIFGFYYSSYVIRRDYTATVVSCGSGLSKDLFVNGIGMTAMVQPTKMMAHLPLAFLPHPPRSALDICFGMGTTFRSLASWNIRVTAVDLVPCVPRAFGYYYDDAAQILAKPNCNVVIDDGKRFLQRSRESYDLITIDPPPPLEAAGSSLLYSTEFYRLAKSHLREGGILQQWAPAGEYATIQAIARSLALAFPCVKIFGSRDYGFHFLASESPLPSLTAGQLAPKIPPLARRDLVEWCPATPPQHLLDSFLSHEISLSTLLNPDPHLVITNDHPYNEYYFLRRLKD